MKTYRLICIDDDPLALDQLRKVMEKITAPVDCVFYGSPGAALAAHAESAADLVLSDLRLGTTNGIELIREMRLRSPGSVFMLLSGEADLQSALAALNEGGIFRFFLKPATRESIAQGLTAAIVEFERKSDLALSGTVVATIDQLPCAVVNLDADGHILFANDRANDLFETRGYFKIGPDRTIRSVNPPETMALLSYLADKTNRRPGAAFRFTHPDRTTPLVLTIIGAPRGGRPGHFTALISDPARKNFVSVAAIARGLGLTNYEARMVHRLIEDGTIEEAARGANVSINTARHYIKTALTRTGASRQAELVRLALMSAA